MIHDVDESIRALLRRDALEGNGVDVMLDAPTKEWATRRNSPAISLYLYDIREELGNRQEGRVVQRNESGHVVSRRPPPRMFRLSYLVTAWTQRPEDEHRLLSSVLGCLLRNDAIPKEFLAGTLSDASVPIDMSIGRPPAEERAISDLWSALGGELKPSLDLVVLAPMEAGVETKAGELVRETPRVGFAVQGVAVQGAVEEPQRPRTKVDVAPPLDAGPADETVVAGAPPQTGRSVRVRTIPRAT